MAQGAFHTLTMRGYFVLVVHGQEVDIVRMGLLMRRQNGTAFAGVFGMIGGEEDGGARLLVIGRGMKVVGGAGSGDGGQAVHPVAIGLHGFYLNQRLALRSEGGALSHVGLTAGPALRRFTSDKEFGWVFESGHGFLFVDVIG